MTRYPGLFMALAWSAAIAAAVVLIPAQPAVGVLAVGAAVPIAALAFVLRPALVALTLAAALLGLGRAELPPADPLVPTRAVTFAGDIAAVSGRMYAMHHMFIQIAWPTIGPWNTLPARLTGRDRSPSRWTSKLSF